MSERTTVPVAALRAIAGYLAGVLSCATLLVGCGQEMSPTKSPQQVAAGEAAGTQSTASSAEVPSDANPDAGQSTAEPPITQADKPAVPAADAQLCEACRAGRLSEVREALTQGADVNARDENGSAAIMLAAFDGHTEIVRLLIEHGVEVNALDRSGRTALMYAASGPNPQTVQLLLVNNAQVNIRDRTEMFTALMFAAAEGHIENVKLLLAHGSDPALLDVDGDTAASFARKNGHTQVIELLQ